MGEIVRKGTGGSGQGNKPNVQGVLGCLGYAGPDVEFLAYGCVCVMLDKGRDISVEVELKKKAAHCA